MSEELKVPDSVKSYNPLVDESVIDNPNVNKTFATNVDYSNIRLEEQEFIPPPIEERKDSTNTDTKKEQQKPVNDDLNDLSEKEKKKASLLTANMILDGYSTVWSYANKLVKISDSKIRQLERKGVIDTNTQIPLGNDRIRLIDAVRQFNNLGGNPFIVSEEFKDEVRPILARVLAKKGIGMTDEQYLIYIFGKDIAEKLIIFKDLFKQRNDFINALIDGCKLVKQMNNNTQNKKEEVYESSNINTEYVKDDTVKVEVIKEDVVYENLEDLSLDKTKDGFSKRKSGRKPKVVQI